MSQSQDQSHGQSRSRLIDKFGREHTYLRISVTDRCNLRCIYCMPVEGIAVRAKSEILTFEEIFRLAGIFAASGVNKIRITGGEPLVRPHIEQLVGRLNAIAGISTLAITTNAVLLKGKVKALKDAGLQVVNISLDSLQSDRFRQITLRDDFLQVIDSLEEVLQADFRQVKLNVVVIKGRNEDEILDFVHYVKDKKLNVRFIEFMPFKDNQWNSDSVVSFAQMKAIIEQHFELVPFDSRPGDVARDFALKGYSGTVSFITSMTESFCSTCNRLRLTADGALKTCLFSVPEVSLRDAMRSGASDEDLLSLILAALTLKPEAHSPMEELAASDNNAMVEIGG